MPNLVVRSNRWMDYAYAAVVAVLCFYSLAEGLKSHLAERCAGRSAGFCEIEKSLDGYAVFGFNPADLIMSALFVVALIYLLRRIASGVAGEIVGTVIVVPTWYGSATVDFGQIRRAETRSTFFGLIRSVAISRQRGRSLAIWNFQGSQLAEVAQALRPILPAQPATPPAT